MTHFIRFPDEATGTAALETAGLLTEDGAPSTASHTHALDMVGVITRGGEWDTETGEQLVAPETLPGWHVNYIGELPEGWEEFVVEPAAPVRVFA